MAPPPSSLPLSVGVIPTIVSPPPSPPPPVSTPAPQPLATVVPIISVVSAPPDTPTEAPPQVPDSQTHPVEVLSLSAVLTLVKLDALGCFHCVYGLRYVLGKKDLREMVPAVDFIKGFVPDH